MQVIIQLRKFKPTMRSLHQKIIQLTSIADQRLTPPHWQKKGFQRTAILLPNTNLEAGMQHLQLAQRAVGSASKRSSPGTESTSTDEAGRLIHKQPSRKSSMSILVAPAAPHISSNTYKVSRRPANNAFVRILANSRQIFPNF